MHNYSNSTKLLAGKHCNNTAIIAVITEWTTDISGGKILKQEGVMTARELKGDNFPHYYHLQCRWHT